MLRVRRLQFVRARIGSILSDDAAGLTDTEAESRRRRGLRTPWLVVPVVRRVGEDLRSGSLCVDGGGRQLARDVGAASYAGRLTADAPRVSTDTTPLQQQINWHLQAERRRFIGTLCSMPRPEVTTA